VTLRYFSVNSIRASIYGKDHHLAPKVLLERELIDFNDCYTFLLKLKYLTASTEVLIHVGPQTLLHQKKTSTTQFRALNTLRLFLTLRSSAPHTLAKFTLPY
jgi:hypothetical protein